MSDLNKKSLNFLNWFSSIGVDTAVQIKPRIRFENKNTNNKKIPLNKYSLEELKKEISEINVTDLKKNATNLVFSDGNPKAKIMIIGEAPGYEEDKLGLPFVGAAGKKLDQMINSIGLNRTENVYITNIIPWRPLNNRLPTDNEILSYLPCVEKHINIINPDIILLFGNIASKAILKLTEGITKFRGKWFNYKNPILKKDIPAMCIFHPSYLLRSPGQKKYAWEDLKKVEKKIHELKIEENEKQ